MGMFDEVSLLCPECHKGRLYWQSKAGDCCLSNYTTASEIPAAIRGALRNERTYCLNSWCAYGATLEELHPEIFCERTIDAAIEEIERVMDECHERHGFYYGLEKSVEILKRYR